MTLSIIIDGKEKIFVSKSIKARILRKAMAITSSVNFSDVSVENLDTVVGFLCDVYGNQFSIDDVYDGIESDKLMPLLISTISAVIGGTASKLGTDTDPNEIAEK